MSAYPFKRTTNSACSCPDDNIRLHKRVQCPKILLLSRASTATTRPLWLKTGSGFQDATRQGVLARFVLLTGWVVLCLDAKGPQRRMEQVRRGAGRRANSYPTTPTTVRWKNAPLPTAADRRRFRELSRGRLVWPSCSTKAHFQAATMYFCLAVRYEWFVSMLLALRLTIGREPRQRRGNSTNTYCGPFPACWPSGDCLSNRSARK